ncbi:PIN domain-containing protein [Adlercreutzia sp. ZJ154]|uniref:type II toxin-antitoxin system VapC family toxin n=1 Tax=Adlercreutzia sp. ZJ154 TaxID=2709790 RepID=UPI0013EDA8EF|nr:PIN domain-containing protein [Adlercreutzia sp. ZJ154]
MKRVYWDSCCFIDFLQGTERGKVLKGVVDKKDNGELEIITSVVTLTEVIKGTAEERDAIIQVFNQDKGLLVVDLTRHLAEQAREVIWNYSFEKHKQDAIHLATAVYINQFHSIDEFHTFDHDLLKCNGRSEIPIPIIEPAFELYPLNPRLPL